MKFNILFLILCVVTTSVKADSKIQSDDLIQNKIVEMEAKKDTVNFGSDILEEAKNFETFLAGLDTLVRIQKEAISKKDFKEACATQDITSEFMINNIKYADDLNNYLGVRNKYQDLLLKINQDRMNNKDGCEGKNVFYKK